MDTPNIDDEKLTKNKRYLQNFRNKQRALGRRARLIWATNDEYEGVKEFLYEARIEKEINVTKKG